MTVKIKDEIQTALDRAGALMEHPTVLSLIINKRGTRKPTAREVRQRAVSEAVKLIKRKYGSEENTLTVADGSATLYLHSKTRSGFHIYSVHTDENGDAELQEVIYDLATRDFRYFRNLKELRTNAMNMSRIFDRYHASKVFKFIGCDEEGHDLDQAGLDFDYETDKQYEDRQKTRQMMAYNKKIEPDERKKNVPITKPLGFYPSLFIVIGAMDKERTPQVGRFLNRLMDEYPAVEQLYFSGIFKHFHSVNHIKTYTEYNGMVNYVLKRIDGTATKPHEALRISKHLLQVIRKEGIKYDVWGKLVDNMKMTSHKDDPKEIQLEEANKFMQRFINQYDQMVNIVTQLEKDYGVEYLSDPEFKELSAKLVFNSLACRTKATHDIFRVARDFDLSTRRAIEYVVFSLPLEQGIPFVNQAGYYDDTIGTWRDYLQMARDVGYSDDFPKHLKTAHDIMAMNYKAVIDEIQIAKYEKIRPKLKKRFSYPQISPVSRKERATEMQQPTLTLVVPNELKDIAVEGSSLNHCVGSYIKNVVKGTSTILFLRDVDDIETSLATVEIKESKEVEGMYLITQARGRFNRDLTLNEIHYLKEWSKLQKNVRNYR